MILHTVQDSPFSKLTLQDCLLYLSGHDKLLLLGDAVIATTVTLAYQDQLQRLSEQGRLYILSDDLSSRGLIATIGKVVDYAEFVSLTISCQSQLKW